MALSAFPELHTFLSTYFQETDAEQDSETIKGYLAKTSPDKVQAVAAQGRRFLDSGDISLEDLGTETNRWFGDTDEASAWLEGIVRALAGGSEGGAGVIVKDSNGAVLAEGDSVQVIKDLKVKGGSSDLKRGTIIKKIHLIDDAENVECRVDGSTLVLKTCFLKKA